MNEIHGKISPEGIQKLYRIMKREEIQNKYNFPTKPSSDGYFHIYVKDASKSSGRKNIKAKTIDELADKILDFESEPTEYNFAYVFSLAQEEKLKYIKDPEKLLSAKNTKLVNQQNFNRYFTGTDLASIPIQNITKQDLESIVLYNLQRYDLRKKAFANMRTILKMTFDYAFEQYLIVDNVYQRVDFKKYNSMLIREVPIETRVHDQNIIDKILEEIWARQAKQPDYMPAYALELQIAMGLRRGEIPPLKWSDVQRGYVYIHQEQLSVRENGKTTHVIVNHTKNWRDRKYPITEDVQNIIDRLSVVSTGEYLFPADTPTGVITNNVVYRFYHKICKKLNVKINRDCIKGTHSFRRNAISNVVNASGGNIIMASRLFGNTPNVAEKNYYTGVDLDVAKNIIDGNQR